MKQDTAALSVMAAIKQRVSVRDYSPQRLDEATILSLLAAAVRAPTAMHRETWRFVIVEHRGQLKQLSDRAKPYFLKELRDIHLESEKRMLAMFTAPDYNLFYNAGTLILICGPTDDPFVQPDCWLAAENLMLAACASGLGSCIIGSATTGLNQPQSKAELRIPVQYSVIVPIIVGVPAAKTMPLPRQDPVVLAWN